MLSSALPTEEYSVFQASIRVNRQQRASLTRRQCQTSPVNSRDQEAEARHRRLIPHSKDRPPLHPNTIPGMATEWGSRGRWENIKKEGQVPETRRAQTLLSKIKQRLDEWVVRTACWPWGQRAAVGGKVEQSGVRVHLGEDVVVWCDLLC